MIDRKMEIEITAKDKTKAAISSARQGFNTLAKGLGIVGAAVGGLGLGTLVKQTLEVADANQKFADRIGASTKGLAGLHHAAGLTGVSTNALNMGLQRMTRRVAEASTGSGEAVKALDKLGISAKGLTNLAPEEQFKVIADELNKVESESERVALAFKLFDSEGVALVNTLKMGSEGLNEVTAEAEALGLAMSRADTAKIEAANDAMLRMQGALQGAVNTLTVELAPILAAVADKLTDASKNAGGFKEEILGFTELGLVGAARLADAWHGWRLIFSGLEVAFKGLGAGIMTGVEAIDETLTRMINNDIRMLNTLIEGMNNIPGVTIPLISEVQKNETIAGMAEIARKELGLAVDDLQTLATQELPSDRIKAWIDEVKEASTVAAQAIEDATVKKVEGAAGLTFDGEEDQDNELLRQKLEEKLGIQFEAFTKENELLALDYEQKQILLDSALAQKLISEEEWFDAMVDADEKYSEARTKVAEKGARDRARAEQSERRARVDNAKKMANAFGLIAQIASSGAEAQGRKDFKREKTARIASAIANTYTAAAEALDGTWYGVAMAAIQIAYGLSQVSRIRAQDYDGGGYSSPAPTPSFPTVAEVPFPEAQEVTIVDDQREGTTGGVNYHIEVHGNVFDSDETARALIEPLEQARLDGVEAEL